MNKTTVAIVGIVLGVILTLNLYGHTLQEIEYACSDFRSQRELRIYFEEQNEEIPQYLYIHDDTIPCAELATTTIVKYRAEVVGIAQARQTLEQLGAKLENNYIFTDTIYVPTKKTSTWSDDFIVIRSYVKGNWLTKKVVMTRKQKRSDKFRIESDYIRQPKVVFEKKFDTEEEAFNFFADEFEGEFVYGFAFSREGWFYRLFDHRIFVEDIEGLPPSVEIEVREDESVDQLYAQLNVLREFNPVIPEAIKEASP